MRSALWTCVLSPRASPNVAPALPSGICSDAGFTRLFRPPDPLGKSDNPPLWTGEIEEELLGRSGFAGRGTAGFTVTPPGIVAVTGLLANSISLWSAPNPGGVVGFE